MKSKIDYCFRNKNRDVKKICVCDLRARCCCAEATKRNPMDDGNNGISGSPSVCCCIPLQPLPACVNEPKVPVAIPMQRKDVPPIPPPPSPLTFHLPRFVTFLSPAYFPLFSASRLSILFTRMLVVVTRDNLA